MLPFGQLQPCVNFFHMIILILWFYNRTISYSYHVGMLRDRWLLSCGFTTGCKIHTFITLPVATGFHVCSHHLLGPRWDRGCQARESRIPVFVPLSRDLPQPRAYRQGIQLRLGVAGPWSRAFLRRDPNTLELRAYRKEPNPKTLAFLTLSLGPSHCLPVLGYALRHSSLLLRVQHLKVTLPDASRPLIFFLNSNCVNLLGPTLA